MRLVLVATSLLALSVVPAFAGDGSGFYAGIYGGGVMSSSAESTLSTNTQVIGTGSAYEHPERFRISGVIPASQAQIARFESDVLATPNISGLLSADILVNGILNYGSSAAFGGVVGYGFGNGVRVELDYSRSSAVAESIRATNKLGTFLDSGIEDDGTWVWGGRSIFDAESPTTVPLASLDLFFRTTRRTTADFLLVNGWYDLDTGAKLTPYVGAGVGLAHLSTSLDIAGCGCDALVTTQSGFVPAAQVGAGVKVKLSDPLSLDFGYRLKIAAAPKGSASWSTEMNIDNVAGTHSSDIAQTGIYTQHTITAGLTYAFN